MRKNLATDQLAQIIDKGSVRDCIAFLTAMPEPDRRALAKTAIAALKAWDKVEFEAVLAGKRRSFDRSNVAKVAVIATASLSQIKALGHLAMPDDGLIVETFQAFPRDWLPAWVLARLEDTPYHYNSLRGLWEAGLCPKPETDAYVLCLMVAPRHLDWPTHTASGTPVDWQNAKPLADRLAAAPEFLPEIWRFFEIEGHGEFSLAAYDKYSAEPQQWGTAICTLADRGVLPRDRLLDAALDALARDFAQFRAGWHSRFYEALKPNLAEQTARARRFVQLLGSANPPTVSFALKAVKQIDKAHPIEAGLLISALRPVLSARQKGSVAAALRLIETAIKRDAAHKTLAFGMLPDALIHEATDIQAKALDLMETLGIAKHPDSLALLGDYVDGVAPSLRDRLATLCGQTKVETHIVMPPEAAKGPAPIEPIKDFDMFIAEFLSVLEDTSEPLRIERVMDGLARFGADRPAGFDQIVSPLAKRAAQITKSSDTNTLRSGLALLAECYTSQTPPRLPEPLAFGRETLFDWDGKTPHSDEPVLITIFYKRNADMLVQVREHHGLSMLSLPTDDRAMIAPALLAQRLKSYEAAGVWPSPYDLSLAFLRLAPEDRAGTLGSLTANSELTQALRYALGGEAVIGKTDWLWIAASAARIPREETADISKAFKILGPDLGTSALYEPIIETRSYDEYDFPEMDVRVKPEGKGRIRDTFLPGLFHLPRMHRFSSGPCGYQADEIRWSATVWPGNLEPFCANGARAFDPDQKLKNSPYAAYIEPLLACHVKPGPMGLFLLAQSFASSDPAVSATAVEVLVAMIDEKRLDTESLAEFISSLMTKTPMPLARWTRALGGVAKVTPVHANAVRHLITGMLRIDGSKAPRDMGGLLELLYELHIQADAKLADPEARTCLEGITAGGKLGSFSKKLLAL